MNTSQVPFLLWSCSHGSSSQGFYLGIIKEREAVRVKMRVM